MESFNKNKIDKAYERIKKLVLKTPLISNDQINKKFNAKIFFKLENLQYTGSFKLRGASNKILQLTSSEKSKGIVSYSSGNHAQAVAYTSSLFNINSTIVMPKNSPKTKLINIKKFGSKVIMYDPLKESREKIANKIAKSKNIQIIKPYDDIDIIAGQGTVGKEICDQLLEYKIKPDLYLCCCGGGGLIAGSSTYIKHIFPEVKIFSVEPDKFNDTELSIINKKIIYNKKSAKSICDALLAPRPGLLTFPINKKNIFKGLSVSDLDVKKTIFYLAENLKIVVEPGGAVAAAAVLNNKVNIKNKNIVVMISGGNIDFSYFQSLIKKYE